jgi:hypothetical protein
MDREALKKAGITIAPDIKGHEHFVEWFVERRDSVDKLPENYVVAHDDYYANYKTHHKKGSKINKHINHEYIPVVGGLVESAKIGRDEPDVFYKMLVKDTSKYSNALYGNTHDISCDMLFVRTDKKQLYRRVFKLKMRVQAECYDLVHEIKKDKPKADADTRLFLMAEITNHYEMDHDYRLDVIRRKAISVSERRYDYERRKKQATPRWANHFKINAIYSNAFKLNKRDGKNTWHVDHEFPLKYRGMNGEEGSGLHIHQNLNVVPRDVNLKKSNKFVTGGSVDV